MTNRLVTTAMLAALPLIPLTAALANVLLTNQDHSHGCTTTPQLRCWGITGPELNYSVARGQMQLQYDWTKQRGTTTTWCTIASEICGPLGLTQFSTIDTPIILRPLGAR
jgi:hypothetical protein